MVDQYPGTAQITDDGRASMPLTTDPEYIPIIESICDVEDIDLIVPTIDDELPLFGRLRSRFEASGVWVAVSSEETGQICNDKCRTYEFAVMNGLFKIAALREEAGKD